MPQQLLNHAAPPRLAISAQPQAAADVEEFIYLISHDVRSSVRALLELPQWIAEDLEEAGFKLDGPVAESIALMNRHTRRLDRMLVDLLTYSRVGRMQTVSKVELSAALDHVLESISLPRGFAIDCRFDCPSIVMGDRDLQTLLFALIDNAVKHHDRDEGRITVTSRRYRGAVYIAVADDGPGIAPEFHDRVFQPMTTLRPRDDVEGTGLGLANVAKIAGLYEGAVQLLPLPRERGTCVEVQLYPGRMAESE
ncbi:sensor histidine kinase [Sulfitobacter maritimus]|uniref:sensor histidine kinase n=1 Tax=Sulfitobacter maritimus TaxID=2741719 RepID=UPI0015840C41|nr:HAMP domain-containing sensor histidine kinase [Sulfitobacter maritimus]